MAPLSSERYSWRRSVAAGSSRSAGIALELVDSLDHEDRHCLGSIIVAPKHLDVGRPVAIGSVQGDDAAHFGSSVERLCPTSNCSGLEVASVLSLMPSATAVTTASHFRISPGRSRCHSSRGYCRSPLSGHPGIRRRHGTVGAVVEQCRQPGDRLGRIQDKQCCFSPPG